MLKTATPTPFDAQSDDTRRLVFSIGDNGGAQMVTLSPGVPPVEPCPDMAIGAYIGRSEFKAAQRAK